MLDRIRVRAEGVGCHCWAFAGERSPDEITVFIEGRFPDGALRPIFEGDIEALRSVTAGVERVRSLVEHPREEGT